MFFFFNDTATTEIYTLSLHDALPICLQAGDCVFQLLVLGFDLAGRQRRLHGRQLAAKRGPGALIHRLAHSRRSEEHTSELQSRQYLVCRLLLEKKKKRLYSLLSPS